MDEDQREKENKGPGDSSGKEKKEWSQSVIAGFRAMLQSQCFPVEGNIAKASPSITTLCAKTVSPESPVEKYESTPSFRNYEDLIQKTLKSLDGFMIILNTDGIIMFVASRIFLLLGHISEEIIGKTLLSLLPESEKRRVYQKISLKVPFSSSVGKHITFGCHIRRGSVDWCYQPTYEYVRIILNVIDITEEPLAVISHLLSRRPDAPMNLPAEDRFYLVGLVCVIKSQTLHDLCTVNELEETEEDTDDEASLDYSFRRVTYPGNTLRGLTYRSEVLSVDPDSSPFDDQASMATAEHLGSRNSSNECNVDSGSSAGSYSSPEISPSWNALTCFKSFSFNLDSKRKRTPKTNIVPTYKYCVVEMEDNPPMEELALVEKVNIEEVEEKPGEEELLPKEEQQALVPVTASMATTSLAIKDTTELLQYDTEYSEETCKETVEKLETLLDLESQPGTSVPCESPRSQTPETMIKHSGKVKRSHSDVFKAKRFRASPLSHTITSEELGEPHDTSTQQVQLPKTGPQDPASPGAPQDPTEVPPDGSELPPSGDEQHVWKKP